MLSFGFLIALGFSPSDNIRRCFLLVSLLLLPFTIQSHPKMLSFGFFAASDLSPSNHIRRYFLLVSLLFLTFHHPITSEDAFFWFLCHFQSFTIQSHPKMLSFGFFAFFNLSPSDHIRGHFRLASLQFPTFHFPIVSKDTFVWFLCLFQLFPICSMSWQHVKNVIDYASTIFLSFATQPFSRFLAIPRSPNLISNN